MGRHVRGLGTWAENAVKQSTDGFIKITELMSQRQKKLKQFVHLTENAKDNANYFVQSNSVISTLSDFKTPWLVFIKYLN